VRQRQGLALLTLDRKSVDQVVVLEVVLLVVDRLLPFGWRFGPRSARRGIDLCQIRPRLGLSAKYRLRCHVGSGCWRGGESLYRIGMPGFWQTDAITGDYRGRTVLQRCIRHEQ